jgi:hypothetical protein
MKSSKPLITLVAALFFAAGLAIAADAPKKEEAKVAACCATAAKDGKTCTHSCCVEAAKKGLNCTACGGSGAAPKKEDAKK